MHSLCSHWIYLKTSILVYEFQSQNQKVICYLQQTEEHVNTHIHVHTDPPPPLLPLYYNFSIYFQVYEF